MQKFKSRLERSPKKPTRKEVVKGREARHKKKNEEIRLKIYI